MYKTYSKPLQIGTRRQITIPIILFKKANLAIGQKLIVRLEKGKIIFEPKKAKA